MYISAVLEMTESIIQILKTLGVPHERIRLESFTRGGRPEPIESQAASDEDGGTVVTTPGAEVAAGSLAPGAEASITFVRPGNRSRSSAVETVLEASGRARSRHRVRLPSRYLRPVQDQAPRRSRGHGCARRPRSSRSTEQRDSQLPGTLRRSSRGGGLSNGVFYESLSFIVLVFSGDKPISSTHHLIEVFMNGSWIRGFEVLVIVALGRASDSPRMGLRDESKSNKMVLVELYTSQGCDMCPTAERILGALAERDRRIVPIAFHVDYFNDPWKDVFSDPLYSQRQMAYNQLYTRPKNPEYGLYYTPMLMIDGKQSVNGRDPPSAEAAIRQALARKPAVRLDVALDLTGDGLSGTATIQVTSRSARAEKSPLLVCPCSARTVSSPTFRRAKMPASRSSRASRPARPSTNSSSLMASHRDATIHLLDRAGLETSEPAAGRVRPGQAHRGDPPGDRLTLANDRPSRASMPRRPCATR